MREQGNHRQDQVCYYIVTAHTPRCPCLYNLPFCMFRATNLPKLRFLRPLPSSITPAGLASGFLGRHGRPEHSWGENGWVEGRLPDRMVNSIHASRKAILGVQWSPVQRPRYSRMSQSVAYCYCHIYCYFLAMDSFTCVLVFWMHYPLYNQFLGVTGAAIYDCHDVTDAHPWMIYLTTGNNLWSKHSA